MEAFDKPEDVALAKELVDQLDGDALATGCNGITGGCLDRASALNLARLVCQAALRTPGKTVTVAGLRGQVENGRLMLSFTSEIREVPVPDREEGR